MPPLLKWMIYYTDLTDAPASVEVTAFNLELRDGAAVFTGPDGLILFAVSEWFVIDSTGTAASDAEAGARRVQ